MTRFFLASAALMLMLTVSSAMAGPIGPLQIQFTGLDLSYANEIVSDAKSPAGGAGDPNDADPLTSVDFTVAGVPQGTLTSDIYADVSIPDVTGLLDAISPNTVTTVVTTPGTTLGYFDLLIGTAPSAAQYLRLDTQSVTITYLDIAGTVQFLFGGAVADVNVQNLPFDIVAGTPLTVSFSTRINAGSKVSEGGVVESFTSAGTGEINGLAIPEPAVCVLAALGLVASLFTRSRA